jgi:hypothetical protein
MAGIRHLRQQEQDQHADDDKRDHDIGNHDDAEVVRLHGLVGFGLRCGKRFQRFGDLAVHFAGQHRRVLRVRVDLVLPEFGDVEAR